jgi:hypothetical protein
VWCKLHPDASIAVWGVEQAQRLAEPDVLAT